MRLGVISERPCKVTLAVPGANCLLNAQACVFRAGKKTLESRKLYTRVNY